MVSYYVRHAAGNHQQEIIFRVGSMRRVPLPARDLPAGPLLKREPAGSVASWPAPQTWSSRAIGVRCPPLNDGSLPPHGL